MVKNIRCPCFLWYNDHMDDLEFVHRFVNRDIPAREEFFKRYSRLIYNYIYQILNAKCIEPYHEHAQDIYQGFIVFLLEEDCRRLRNFKGLNNCSLATWIRHLTVNFTLGYLRKIDYPLSLDAKTDDDFCLQNTLADKSLIPRQVLVSDESVSVLYDCIDALNLEDKLIIELNFYRKLSLEAIRVFLNVTRGAMDMKKARLISKIRDCFRIKGFKLDL